jgi:signal transduction histidine kinase
MAPLSRAAYRSPVERRVARDRVVDVLIYVVLVGAMFVEAWIRDQPISPAAAAAMVVAPLPTLLRRTHPGWALVLCMAGLYLVFVFIDVHNTVPFSSMVCGYSLALVVDRRRAILAGLALVPFVVGAVIIFHRGGTGDMWFQMPKNLGFVAAPLLLGLAVRNRRDYLAEVVERAETAERTREEETRRRVGEERLRIARDLHDVVAHAMVAINVQAGVGAHLLDRDPEQARRTLLDIQRVSGEALADLRATLGALRAGDTEAPVLPTQGWAELEELGAGLRSAGIEVDLDLDPATSEVPSSVAATGYRIVQEALTNVVRHAPGAHAQVRVTREADRVVVEVTDDGRGAVPVGAPAPDGSGNGLRGMQERARAVGGTLDAGPMAGGGWRVRASLPLGTVGAP